MADRETLRVDTTGDVATITIDRPEKLNALNPVTLDALGSALDEVRDADARCLVVTGAGAEAFAAGADIGTMREFSTAEAQAYAESGHRVARALETFPAPTVAAINGYALGGGLELALACDFRIAAHEAVLGQPETDLGIIPGWGGTQRLPRLVGDEVARRMIFLGERLDATDAREYGLVSEVVAGEEFADRIEEFAAELAARPRNAVWAAKEAIDAAREGSSSGLAHERRAFSGLFGTPDQREGMDAFVEDREPEFE